MKKRIEKKYDWHFFEVSDCVLCHNVCSLYSLKTKYYMIMCKMCIAKEDEQLKKSHRLVDYRVYHHFVEDKKEKDIPHNEDLFSSSDEEELV
jgi:transcription elongation factor Elf1